MSPKRYRKSPDQPKIKKRIIIFSSKESINLAKAIQSNLYIEKYSTQVWSDSFFKLSRTNITNFDELKYNYDYAFVICSGDDTASVRGRKTSVLRDNVLLELGMCISSFSLNHVIIVKQKGIKLPSDLDGITPIEYSIGVGEDINAVAGTICSKAEAHINTVEPSPTQFIKLSWDEYFRSMHSLTEILSQSAALGGFDYDVAVGINRGGLMAADLMAREKGHDVPVLSLCADRKTGDPLFVSDDLIVNNYGIINILQSEKIKNILVVDSFTRNGQSIFAAQKFLADNLPDKTIKTAVIYVNQKLKNKKNFGSIDYVGSYVNLDGKRLSISSR